MSFANPYRTLLDEARHEAHHDTPRHDRRDRDRDAAPAARARAVASMRRLALDRRLAEGAAIADDPALTARAWQITRLAARRRLASSLVGLLREVDRPMRARGAIVPICRAEVDVARDEIVLLAERLRDPRPVRPRGVALVRRLLTDGCGPLYVASPNDELWRQLRRAMTALD